MGSYRWRWLLMVILLEGSLAFYSLLAMSSEPQSAVWMGFSPRRLALAGVVLLALLLLAACALAARTGSAGWSRVTARVKDGLAREDRLLLLTLFLGMLVLVAAWGVLFSWLFVPTVLRWLLAWLGLVAAQGLLFLRLEFSSLYRDKRVAARIFNFPRLKNLDGNQRRVLLIVTVVGILYWAGFIFPNLRNSDAHALQYTAGDEGIIYPILIHMFAPSESFRQGMGYFHFYEDYHYGFPFYFLSALLLLPGKILIWGNQAELSQLNLLLLRQFVSVAPLVLSAGLLVWLQTRFRTLWKTLALFGLLLLIPEVVNYNIQFWHPDGLTVLCTVLTIYFLDRDHLRFGSDFYIAAICCGLASALRLYGFFFVLVVPVYLAAGQFRGRLSWRRLILHALGFVLLMLAVFLLTSPYLFDSHARARAIEILFSKTDEFAQGYADIQDPQGFFRMGLGPALMWLSYPYAPPFYLAFLLLSLGAACVFGQETFANRLILLWILPPAIYLIWFVAARSSHYWLPLMMPFYSAAFGLPALVEEVSLPPLLRKIARLALGLLLASLAATSIYLIFTYFV